MSWLTTALYSILFVLIISLKVVYQYERGVKFTLGKFSGIMNPGLRLVIPILQEWRRIDMRTRVIDVPEQDAMTKDNVTVKINAVVYYRIMNAKDSVIKIEQYNYAISQLSQTTMRNSCGEVSLDQLLSNREKISAGIQQRVDKATDPWGIKILDVELKDIKLPTEMIRTIAKQAEAERERRAVIIKADAEVKAAGNMIKAAGTLGRSDGAMHLRTLQALNDMSSDQSNTIHVVLPIEVMGAYEGGR